MKAALRIVRTLTDQSSKRSHNPNFNLAFLPRLYAAQPQPQNPVSGIEEDNSCDGFDSRHYELPEGLSLGIDSNEADAPSSVEPTWDEKYRWKANKTIFAEDYPHEHFIKEKKKTKMKSKSEIRLEKKEDERRRGEILAKTLLQAALEGPDEDDDEVVKVEDQMSLSVGIIGPPNAGKSTLTNLMVGTKVAAVSRKTNTTTHEVLGVMNKGKTQICFFDTPGLTRRMGKRPKPDLKVRVESAWRSIDLYDVLIVIFDVHRHLSRPDTRVVGLIKQMGSEANPKQKRILCMNKVDLVENKKDLLKVSEQFKDLPAYERYFMISGHKASGVKDLTQYLIDQAVKRPWDEEPLTMTEEVMKNVSLEVVREKLLDHVHQEIPYHVEHRLVDWKELPDGSIRIEQHFVTSKMSQRRILIGKNGSKIGKIGMEANEELRSIFKRKVHLILLVRSK